MIHGVTGLPLAAIRAQSDKVYMQTKTCWTSTWMHASNPLIEYSLSMTFSLCGMIKLDRTCRNHGSIILCHGAFFFFLLSFLLNHLYTFCSLYISCTCILYSACFFTRCEFLFCRMKTEMPVRVVMQSYGGKNLS